MPWPFSALVCRIAFYDPFFRRFLHGCVSKLNVTTCILFLPFAFPDFFSVFCPRPLLPLTSNSLFRSLSPSSSSLQRFLLLCVIPASVLPFPFNVSMRVSTLSDVRRDNFCCVRRCHPATRMLCQYANTTRLKSHDCDSSAVTPRDHHHERTPISGLTLHVIS